jgi:hypothetical protein
MWKTTGARPLQPRALTRPERALAFALGLEAGMTHINDSSANNRPTAPFGGEWIMQEFLAQTLGHSAAPAPASIRFRRT